MTLVYTIQGFNLHQPDIGFKLMQTTSYASPISPRRVNLEIPRMHGQVPMWDDELGPAKLLLRVRIQDEDPAQLELKWQHLRALMWTGSNTGLTVRREINSELHYAFAQLENMTEPDFYCAAGMIDVDILLNIPYGRWESVQVYEQNFTTNSGTSGISFDFVAQSTAPVSRVLVRFGGGISQANGWVELHDDTSLTGFRMTPGSVVSPSEYVLVDVEQGRAWINTTSDWDARQTEITPGLRPLRRGMLSLVSVPSFQMGVRTNNARSFRSASATTTTGTIQGRRTYL